MTSSGSSDSGNISDCEFETTSESDKESIRGCCNNEPEYSQEKIDKMKEKNGSISETEGSKEDDNKLGSTPLLGGKLENIECVTFCSFIVLPVVFVHLYAWQAGILINVNVNCEMIKCNKHQQQITNKLIICITETKN